jgi:hypothetical protein
MGQGGANDEIRPAIAEALHRFALGYIKRVAIRLVDLGERLD